MSLIFDGTNKRVTIPDNVVFTPGNGAGTDTAMSWSAWVNMTDASNFIFIGKGADNITKREWLFYSSSTDKLSCLLLSGVSTARIGRLYNTAITALQGTWVHVVATYSGSKSSSGIKIYLNGVQVDDTDSNSGSYTGVPNSDSTVDIGWNQLTPAYSNGASANVSIWNKELSIAEIQSLYYGQGSAEYHLPGCIAFWPLQGLSGAASTTALMDVRGGYNTSDPTGSPVFGDNPLRTDRMGRVVNSFDFNTVATPTVDPDGGTFTTSQEVTLATTTDGATIYYTTDGSTPDDTDTEYTAPFTITETTTVKAIAVKVGYYDSAVKAAEFTASSGERKRRIRLFNHLALLRRSALLGMARRKAIEEKKEKI